MRPSFRLQLTLAYALGLVALVAVLAWMQGHMAARRAGRDRADTLLTLARSTSMMLADGLADRLHEVELMARSTPWNDRQWQGHLDTLQRMNSHVNWVGLVDAQGTVRVATQGLLVGRDVSARPWFQAGLRGPHVGDVHPAPLLAPCCRRRPPALPCASSTLPPRCAMSRARPWASWGCT